MPLVLLSSRWLARWQKAVLFLNQNWWCSRPVIPRTRAAAPGTAPTAARDELAEDSREALEG
jgi:hypothetical protein